MFLNKKRKEKIMVSYNPQSYFLSNTSQSFTTCGIFNSSDQVTFLFLASIYKFSKSMIHDLYTDIWFAIVSDKTWGAMIF